MADEQISLSALLANVRTVMGLCVQSVAQSSALADLLIEKGVVTKEALDAKMSESQKATKKLADSLALIDEDKMDS